MKKISSSLTILFILSCSSVFVKENIYKPGDELVYVVNLNDRDDDLFDVHLYVNNLETTNAVYQFAASAPGTYQTMDMGRYVRLFTAYDQKGSKITSQHISTNQWEISEPEKVESIHYQIAETWDTPVDSNQIYPMCGTSIEADHVLINGQAVFGYPTGMQKRASKIKLIYPASWTVGTALNLDSDGFFEADDYDQIVDSPILTGVLTEAALDVRGTKIEVFVYSENGLIVAKEILNRVDEILNAAADFTNGLPVDRYTFLFNYENHDFPGGGAWEHNYSSIYALNETPIESQRNLPRVMAHEFFHIITPLNLHSELIEHFNFVHPQPSEHLWLYEATTEWAAQIMQLRAGLMDLSQYLEILSHKLKTSDQYRKDYSLSELSLNSFSKQDKGEYVNIYYRGAIIAGLLDIKLLELSNGQRGLREVINELSKVYGPEKAFDERNFFNTFTDFTYPEVADFINRYIKKAETLPVADYFSKLGITYIEEQETGKIDTTRGYSIGFDGTNFIVKVVDTLLMKQGLKENDIIKEINGQAISLKNIRSLVKEIDNVPIKKSYSIKISEAGSDSLLTLKKITTPNVIKHTFLIDENPGENQLAMRNAWLKNL